MSRSERAWQLRLRVLTIAWGLPVTVVFLRVGGWLLALGSVVLAVFALGEFWGLGRFLGVAGRPRWEVLGAAVLILAGASIGMGRFLAALAAALVVVMLAAVVRGSAQRGGASLRQELETSVWAILALLYIPWLLGYVLLMRHTSPAALEFPRTLGAVVLVWLGDVGAFIVGGLAGRHRLAEAISPGKSVEGAVAALALGAVGGTLAAPLLALPLAAGAVVGAALGAAGLLGDLWESLLKRGAGVKDSGASLPGHGGVLDRFDSLLVGAPVGYWLMDRVPWTELAHWLGPLWR